MAACEYLSERFLLQFLLSIKTKVCMVKTKWSRLVNTFFMSGLVFDELYWDLVREYVTVDVHFKRPIVVIGAGVIGLSHAIACKASFPNSQVSVVASDYISVTSAVSAGVWFPCMVEDKIGQEFAEVTYKALLKYVKRVEETVPGAGCQNLAACWRERRQFFFSFLFFFSRFLSREKGARGNPIITTDSTTMSLDPNENFDLHVPMYVENRKKSESFAPSFKSGLDWTTIIIQSQLMLPLMRRLCVHRGIALKRQEVKSMESFLKTLVCLFFFFFVSCCLLDVHVFGVFVI